MNPRKLEHQHSQEQQTGKEKRTTQTGAGLEFSSVEDAIRHDAAQVELPPAIAERLRNSIQQEQPTCALPWWKRWWRS